MAKINDGLFGGFSGKIGNVIGCKGRTGFYVRARPAHVSNPRTKQQQEHRGKFTLAMRLACSLTSFLRVSYREFAGAGKPFHAAVSSFLKGAVIETDIGCKVDFDKVLVSRGSLTAIHKAKVESTESKVIYSWVDNSGEGNALATDTALLVVFNKSRWEAIYEITSVLRSEGQAKLQLPFNWSNDPLAVYLGFRSQDGEVVANSICLLNEVAK